MKKLLAAVIVTSGLTGVTMTAEASPALQVSAPMSLNSAKAAQSTKVELPDLTDEKVIESLKNGTYSYKGVELNDSFQKTYDNIGKPDKELMTMMDLGSYNSLLYGKQNELVVSMLAHKRTSLNEDMKVDSFDFYYPTKNTKLSSIKSLIGKPKERDFSDFNNKNKKDDSLRYQFENYGIGMERPNGTWIITELSYTNNSSLDIVENAKPGKLKNKMIKPLTDAQLKAMRKGTFKYYGIQPGMTFKQVTDTIGDSNEERMIKYNNVQLMSTTYGQVEPFITEYSSMKRYSDVNKAKVKTLKYDYSENNKKLTTLEKSLGKASTSKTKVMQDEGTGGEKVTVLKTTYGKHTTLYSEKENKQWIVKLVQYQ